MNTPKKVLLFAACALVLAAASVMGTLAYLTSADEVTNTFTVGKVAITLDEAKVDEKGQAIEGADRVKSNTYKLMPGINVDKDPTVTVKADSEDCHVRVIVTTSKPEVNYMVHCLAGRPVQWQLKSMSEQEDGCIRLEFRYAEKVLRSDKDTVLPPVFTGIQVPGSLDNDDMKVLDNFSINVVAQAIQADGFADADAAWAAFPQK